MNRRVMLGILLGGTTLLGSRRGLISARADSEEPSINWPSDLSKLEGLELDHVPIVEVRQMEDKDVFDLMIRVGQELHAMTEDHAIRWLEIWIDDLKAMEAKMEPRGVLPRWTYTLARKPSMKVTVKAGCNLHGIWANRIVL